MKRRRFSPHLSREDGWIAASRWLRRLHLDLPLLVLVLLTAAYGLVVLYSSRRGFGGLPGTALSPSRGLCDDADCGPAGYRHAAALGPCTPHGLGIVMLVLVLLVGVQAKEPSVG